MAKRYIEQNINYLNVLRRSYKLIKIEKPFISKSFLINHITIYTTQFLFEGQVFDVYMILMKYEKSLRKFVKAMPYNTINELENLFSLTGCKELTDLEGLHGLFSVYATWVLTNFWMNKFSGYFFEDYSVHEVTVNLGIVLENCYLGHMDELDLLRHCAFSGNNSTVILPENSRIYELQESQRSLLIVNDAYCFPYVLLNTNFITVHLSLKFSAELKLHSTWALLKSLDKYELPTNSGIFDCVVANLVSIAYQSHKKSLKRQISYICQPISKLYHSNLKNVENNHENDLYDVG